MANRFLRRPEVEARCGLSRGTILQQDEREVVSSTDAHRQARRGVREEDVDRWIAQQTVADPTKCSTREDGLTMSLQILDRLRGVRKIGDRKWTARCPAHDDRSPSLSIRECDDWESFDPLFYGLRLQSDSCGRMHEAWRPVPGPEAVERKTATRYRRRTCRKKILRCRATSR